MIGLVLTGLATFLSTTAGIITSITVIIGAVISLAAWGKKGLKKMFKEQLTPVTNDIKKVSNDITEIKQTNEDQMIKINQLLENQEQLAITDKHVLRALITGKYYEYSAKCFLPMYERECVSLLYEDYKALHGNTFIDGLYEKMMMLPCEPPIPFESSELIK